MIERATEIAKSVPVILALNSKQLSGFSHAFKKLKVVNLGALCKPGTFAEMQAQISNAFPNRFSDDSYGIFAITEDLARGVDFPTSYQIEEAGGAFALICDVFPSVMLQ